jgi:hypothetical protein
VTLTINDIAELYVSGASVSEVARRSHRSTTSVREVLASAGIPRRPPGGESMQLPQAVVRRTIELYREHGARRAAEILGVHQTTIRYRCRTAGEPIDQAGQVRAPRPVPAGYETAAQVAAREGVTTKAIRRRLQRGTYPGAYLEPAPRGRWLIPTDQEAADVR